MNKQRPGSLPPVAAGACVLVVEHGAARHDDVQIALTEAGFDVVKVAEPAAAAATLADRTPDAVVVDLKHPVLGPSDVLDALRASTPVPVLVLVPRRSTFDGVAALERGADDFVTAPYAPREVVARLRSLLRRATPHPRPDVLRFPGLIIDGRAREVRTEGGPVQLAPKQFDLLWFLASSPRSVFSRAELLRAVWKSAPEFQDASTVNVHVRRLRQAIEADGHKPRWITTVQRKGYRFDA